MTGMTLVLVTCLQHSAADCSVNTAVKKVMPHPASVCLSVCVLAVSRNKSSAVAKMAAQCYRHRIVKRWSEPYLTKIRGEAPFRGNDS